MGSHTKQKAQDVTSTTSTTTTDDATTSGSGPNAAVVASANRQDKLAAVPEQFTNILGNLLGPAVYNELQSYLSTNVSAAALTGYGATAVDSLIDQIIALGQDGLSKVGGDVSKLGSQFSAPLAALLKQQATALLNSPTGQGIAQFISSEAETLAMDPAMVMLAIVTAGAVAYETDLKLNIAKQQVLDTKLLQISAGGDFGSMKDLVLKSLDVTVSASIGKFSGTLNVTKTSATATGKDGGWSGQVTDDFGPGGKGVSGKIGYVDPNVNFTASGSKDNANIAANLTSGKFSGTGFSSTMKGNQFTSDGTLKYLDGGFSINANGSMVSTGGMSIAKGSFEVKDKSLFDLKSDIANHGGDASLNGAFKAGALGNINYTASGTYASGTFLGTGTVTAVQGANSEILQATENKDGTSDVNATVKVGSQLSVVLDNKDDPKSKTDNASVTVSDKLKNGTTIAATDQATFKNGKLQNTGNVDVKGKNYEATLKQSNSQTSSPGSVSGASINSQNVTANLTATDPAAKATYTASGQYQQQGAMSGGSGVVTYKDPNVDVSNLSYGVTPQGVQNGDLTATAGANSTHETYQKNGVNSSFTTNVATDPSNAVTGTLNSTTTTSQPKAGGDVNTVTTGHAKLAYAAGQTNVAVLADMDDKGVLRFTQTGQVDTHTAQPEVSSTGDATAGKHDLMALTQASFDGSTHQGEVAVRFLENQYIVKGFQFDPVTGQFELALPQELTKVIQAYVTGNFATPDHEPGSIDKYRLQHLQMLLSSSFSGQWGNFSSYGKYDAVNNEANALVDARINTGGNEGKPNLRVTGFYDYHFDQAKLTTWAALIGYDQPADGTGWLQQALLEYKYSNAPTMPMNDFAAHVEMAFGKYEVHLQSDVSMNAPNTTTSSGYVGMPINQSIYVYGGLSYSSGTSAAQPGTSIAVGAQIGGIAAGPTYDLKTGKFGFTLVAPFGGKKKK